MKNLIPFLFIFFIACKKESATVIPPAPSDSAFVTVNNGYGSGQYKFGDTVHIFSVAYTDNELFNTWAGADAGLLNGKDEWHTWFIMPSHAVTLTGSIKNSASFTLSYEKIKGRDIMKPVYYYFPAGHTGFVYLLHGTGGNADNVVNGFEFTQLIKDIITSNLGVIITEAEEATTGTDADGDGNLRWATTPQDSVNNVDYANIKAITDTFYSRGITSRNKLRYSVGMSNGGNFSAFLSSFYKFKAGVSYCAPAGAAVINSTTPFQFCMARYDNNPNVGPQGNAAALSNSQTLTSHNVCSRYLVKEHSPLYAERFARRGDISITQSAAIFNELKSNGFLDSKNYFIGFSDALTTAFAANPSAFPQLGSTTLQQRQFVLEQVNLSVSDHHMYSDYNRATLKFLNTQCQ